MSRGTAFAFGVGSMDIVCPQGVAIECDTVKRWQRAIGNHLLPQHPAVGGRNRAVLRWERDARLADEARGFGGRERGRS
jgi:hypothetical protein